MKKTVEEFLADSNYSKFVKAGGIKYKLFQFFVAVGKKYSYFKYITKMLKILALFRKFYLFAPNKIEIE